MSAGGGGPGDRPDLQVRRVLAPNPGPFTLEGTNTWVVGRDVTVVIDPGPEDEAHLEAVARAAGRIQAILLSHHHPDHAPGASRLARLTGAPVLSFDPGPGEDPLGDGQTVEAPTVTLRAVHSPGHTPDHLVFLDQATGSLFTGDAVLGRGTSVVDPPQGDLAAYLESLRTMLALSPTTLYPGHGPMVEDGPGKLREYLAHRAERERQVLAGLEGGPKTAAQLVPGIYADYPPELHPVAARAVLAHLLKLEMEGRVERSSPSDEAPFRLFSPSGPESGNVVTR
jgi:glyoxylase-like metal-dependent hydrolase (beta-lactamase superfamily II)